MGVGSNEPGHGAGMRARSGPGKTSAAPLYFTWRDSTNSFRFAMRCCTSL